MLTTIRSIYMPPSHIMGSFCVRNRNYSIMQHDLSLSQYIFQYSTQKFYIQNSECCKIEPNALTR